MSTVIAIENVSKSYRLGLIGTGTLREDLQGWWHRVRGLPDPNLRVDQKHSSIEGHTLWALQDVSLEIQQGEMVGLIGRNGAGKSTLLKILSRVTAPTSGRIRVRGRVASLLEVGTGFHPELTGRENIFLNGAILGMTKAEVARKFDEIVAFSEIEQFIDTPVKRYSSGMYVRLAFAVAAHLESEILVVDEVLAVGDAAFQKKCMGKMGDVAGAGRTVLFVSHNMVAIQSLCRRAVLLGRGQLMADGEAGPVVSQYLQNAQGPAAVDNWQDPQLAPGNDVIRIKRVQVLPDTGAAAGLLTMQTPVRIETEYWVVKGGAQIHLTYHLVNDQGIVVLTSGCPSVVRDPGLYRATVVLPANLLNSGGYSLKLMVIQNGSTPVYTNDRMAAFTVVDVSERTGAWMGREPSVVQVPLQWTTEVRSP